MDTEAKKMDRERGWEGGMGTKIRKEEGDREEGDNEGQGGGKEVI